MALDSSGLPLKRCHFAHYRSKTALNTLGPAGLGQGVAALRLLAAVPRATPTSSRLSKARASATQRRQRCSLSRSYWQCFRIDDKVGFVRTWFRLGLVALAVALGMWAYMHQPSSDVEAPPSPEATAGDVAATVLAEALLNSEQVSTDELAWRVTQANSTADVMIVDVEAERPNEALAIAEEIVAPLTDSYVEVVVYVRSLDRTDDDSVRRIQWTPRGGYIETTYSDQ